MTVSLVAVLIPVLFLSGILGRLFREVAITISVAILISGFVSLSLTPMLCSRLLKAIGHRREDAEEDGSSPAVREGPLNQNADGTSALPAERGKWWQKTERAYDWLVGGYRWTLRIALEHRALTMLICGGPFLVTIGLLYVIPKGFISKYATTRLVGY